MSTYTPEAYKQPPVQVSQYGGWQEGRVSRMGQRRADQGKGPMALLMSSSSFPGPLKYVPAKSLVQV